MLKLNYLPKMFSQTPINQVLKNKKRSTSQTKYQNAPDIMTQAKPSYLNNFVQPINPHQSAFTPTNRSKNMDQHKLLLPKKTQEFANKKTLILDLDETLVHSSFVPFEENDIILNIEFESVLYNIYVMVRPGAIQFLKKVSKLFEVIVFTASIAKYALPLLDILDQENNIKYRLTREHCTFLNGIYIKELKKLNRNLKDLIIVDNSPLAYAFDSDNGLPIKTWYDDINDIELEKIFPLLEFLSTTKDVRPFINQFVSDNEIIYEDSYEIINAFTKQDMEKEKEKDKENDKNSNNTYTNNNINKDTINNKEENNKKAISVNININIKNKTKNNEINLLDCKYNNNNDKKYNNKEAQKINDKIEKENNTTLINNPTIIYNNEKKESSYSINTNTYTNLNLKKNISHKCKNLRSGIMNKKNIKEMGNNKQGILNQKKKNSFRKGQKFGEKIPIRNNSNINNIHLNNNIYNNYFINNINFPINNDNDFAFGLPLSNTTKNKLSNKTQIKYNNNNEKNNSINKKKNKEQFLFKKNIIYDKDNTLNNNYTFKHFKFTNLLEKLENKTIKSNYSLNNKSQTIRKPGNIFKDNKKIKFNLNKKINDNKAGSSLIENYQSLVYNPTSDNKLNNNTHVSRSKSSGNFVNFASKINQKPKTPKGHFIFDKKVIIGSINDINKNKKEMISGFSKTTRHKQFVKL